MNKKLYKLICLAALNLIIAGSVIPANALGPQNGALQASNTYYVAANGNNASPGSLSEPWQTIQKAVNTITAGDTVIVMPGEYPEFIKLEKSNVELIANGRVNTKGFLVAGNDNLISGFTIANPASNYGIMVSGNNNRIENNEIFHTKQDGIWFFGHDNAFRGNYLHDILDPSISGDPHVDCYQTWGSNWETYNILFERNFCNHTRTSGSNQMVMLENQSAYPMRNITFRNNVFIMHDAGDSLMNFHRKSGQVEISNIYVTNNTFYNTTLGGNEAVKFSNISNGMIVNNVSIGYSAMSKLTNGSDAVISNNVQSGDYGMVDYQHFDFHLAASSPLIDAGSVVPVANDFDGITRPQGNGYDVGAFEYSAITEPTATAPATQIPPSATPTQTPIVETATFMPAETPSATTTPLPTATTAPAGQAVITSASSKTLLVGETSLISVSLANTPAGGYTSVEFTCTFAPDQIKTENIQIATLFGNDPVSAFQDQQNGIFILAIAGSNGNKALTDGLAFTFTASGLKAGQSSIECTARVPAGDNTLMNIVSVPDTLTVLDNAPTTAPVLPPTITGQVIASKPVIVSLLNSDSSIAAATIANSDGTFLLTAAPGSYVIIASAEGCLNAQGIITLTDGVASVMPVITLPAGDIDGNAVIDQYDALTLGMSYNIAAPAPADLSNDGLTNIFDLEMLAENYRKAGALSWQ